jgi:uncharacterized delta-60 repeat protein
VVVVGEFSGVADGARQRVARLNTDGSVDLSFDPWAWLNGEAYAVAVQPDGRVLVGGAFTMVDGVIRNRLVRFNADGTLDGTFNPGTGPNNLVYSLLVQPNGQILVGGAFSAYNNNLPNGYLVRLFSDGSLDPDFNAGVNGAVWAMGLGGDGKLVLGGQFTSVLGTVRNRVARLNVDGTLDAGFNPAAGPNGTVRALALQPDGKVLIGGEFGDVAGTGHPGL